ncbi:hypothetical protein CJF42_25705 [Pseudoalteromonas sp. NBT06-2]|uniref:hypothetical protein n=1 Tax=Pseudoalteromonas sp. NBT06-2 TaxID=2025950 RepID=UPI000BA765A1|nr:hypothetical protein [Pseudoalteromonas sp. NBT06-2]PAJ71628.1 hypothetical protein CJF42_25705 [Pseudoalteromonas sp. NBT06-2]
MSAPLDLLFNNQWDSALGLHYHMLRQQFFSKWHRITGILTLVFSTSAVLAITNNTQFGVACMAFVAILQAIDLYVDSRGNSDKHNAFKQEYINFEKDLIRYPDGLTEEQNKDFQIRLKEIELKEPPPMRTLLEIVNNDVASKLKAENREFDIHWFKRLTSQYINWKSKPKVKK